jgi:hypothetical protein
MRKCLIFLIAAAFLAVSAMPATAQDDGAVAISGGAMLETYWESVNSTMNTALGNGNSSTTDLTWGLITPGTSIAFNFKKGDISGEVVLRPFAGSNSRMYGAWNFGAGTLTIGNFNAPFRRPQSALHHLGGKAKYAGNLDMYTRDQGLMLTFPLGGGTLEFAALRLSGVARGDASIVKIPNPAFPVADPPGPPVDPTIAITDDSEAVIPKLEVSYDVKFGGFNLWLGGSYQTYSERVSATNKEYDIDSWGLSIYGSYGFGPVTINGGYTIAQNPLQHGFPGTSPPGVPSVPITANGAAYDPANDTIVDSDMSGYHLSAGWKISDMLTLQAGIGGNEFEQDKLTGQVVDAEDTTAFYYINMPIFAAKGLTITPEIGVRDEKDVTDPTTGVSSNQGKATYYGLRWFIRF